MFEGSDSITPYCPHDVLVLVVRVHGNVTGAIGCIMQDYNRKRVNSKIAGVQCTLVTCLGGCGHVSGWVWSNVWVDVVTCLHALHK